MTEPDRTSTAPHYKGLRTLILDSEGKDQIAWLDAAIWPHVGEVIELGNPRLRAVVTGVSLSLPQFDRPVHGDAVIHVHVEREQTVA